MKIPIENVKAVLVGLAAYYNAKLTDLQLAMYAEDLADLTQEELTHAVRTYRLDPRAQRFPLPATLRSLARPLQTTELQAVEIAGRIWGAIGKFGWPHPELARAAIGEDAWFVVEHYGGWRAICGESIQCDSGVFRAHLRESAKAALVRKQSLVNILSVPGMKEPKSLPGGLQTLGYQPEWMKGGTP